jgi:hypothetical protein
MEVPTLDQLEPVLRPFSTADVTVYDTSIDVDLTVFNTIDSHTLAFYVRNGYRAINKFLINLESAILFKSYSEYKIINILLIKFPKEDTIDDTTYAKKILYYYFVNLYSTIQKFPRSQSPFMVYRGSTTHYLKEDSTDLKYYTNSFL